jgi:hypothetical protein
VRLEAIIIRKYLGMLYSGRLSFAPAFNLVVGANNVGKSSLLACLAATVGGEPHGSIHILPTRDETLNPISRVDIRVVANGQETTCPSRSSNFAPIPSWKPCGKRRGRQPSKKSARPRPGSNDKEPRQIMIVGAVAAAHAAFPTGSDLRLP